MPDIFPAEFTKRAEEVLAHCRARRWRIATAESCSGGLIAALLTAIPGSSDVFEGGFVTYSNELKTRFLEISPSLIRNHGAVSEEVARAMALNAMKIANVHLALACTGIAGPGGGSAEKPVGRVHIALACGQGVHHMQKDYRGMDRDGIRLATAGDALTLARECLTC